jgi:divalent metal cation (Fe/Co/Zn/Cd) transporter
MPLMTLIEPIEMGLWSGNEAALASALDARSDAARSVATVLCMAITSEGEETETRARAREPGFTCA